MKKHNFSAGPAILANSVLDQASKAVKDLDGIGLSLLEISHRGSNFKEILLEAHQSVRDLLNLSDDYGVMYLTGGASSQFFMTPMNLLNPSDTAAYVNTGSWSSKAIKEAGHFGSVEVIASSKDQNFNYIPKGYSVPANARYLHITTNNTIFGTQYHALPETSTTIVADMSSDIFSKEIDASKFGLIYAGAQKNLGPAGTTLVIVRKDLLGKVERSIPTMLDYRTHIEKNSAFNTPPCYAIYVCMLSLRWIKEQGGIAAVQKLNEEKAAVLYNAIDSLPHFKGTAVTEDRSLMNVPFVLTDSTLESDFLSMCDDAGIVGLKGHRSVGGFRASIYNAMPIDSVKVLIDVMENFSNKVG